VNSINSMSVLRVRGVSHVQTVQIVASGPPFSEPHGLVLDPRGDLYVADHGADELMLLRGATAPAVPFAHQAGMGPIGLALGPDGALYIGGFGSGALERYDLSGSLTTTTLDPAGNSFLQNPSGLTFGPDGMLYVAINASNRIEKVNPTTGADLGVFASYPSLVKPSGVRFGKDGRLYVVDWGGARVLRFDGTTGAFVDVFVASGAGGLSTPAGLEFGPDGNLYVCNYGGNSVAVFDGVTGASMGPFISGADGLGLSAPTWMVFVTK
jgi:DNA-binding beta-propeller fold protein YncE